MFSIDPSRPFQTDLAAYFDAQGQSRALLEHGTFKQCTLAEYAAWCVDNPNPWLLRTPCLGGHIETVFDGHGARPPFQSFWVSESGRQQVRRERQGADPKQQHASAVRAVVRQFFSYPMVRLASTLDVPSPLYGPTDKSSLLIGQPRDPLYVEPGELKVVPNELRSLRYRLMRALGKGSSTWYSLQNWLSCEENRALRTLELAWNDGLLIRTEMDGPREAPILALSEKGRQLYAEGKLSMAQQGGQRLREDVHVHGWEPWSGFTCPLCGGGVQGRKTRRGNIKITCIRGADGFLVEDTCPGGWLGVLKNERLIYQGAQIGGITFWVEHWANRTRVLKDRVELHPIPEALAVEKLRAKLKLLVTFS